MINFDTIKIGEKHNASEIAEVTNNNQVKGIQTIEKEGILVGVAILCTIQGDFYKNEWIVEDKILKYYMEGRTDKKTNITIFNENIKSNQAIINSVGKYPLFVFVRNSKKELFTFKGKFTFDSKAEESDDAKYFVLIKENEKLKISDVIIDYEDNESYPEGKEKEKLHKYKERNRRLIQKAKSKFKELHEGELFCEVCGFNFKKRYGKIGEDYIECHHIIPLSELKEGDLTKISDLVMLCSNCHRMIHKRRPWLNKENLTLLLKKEVL